MAHLPIMLKLKGRRVVVVGGGEVAARRVAALVDAGAKVTVIAPAVDRRITDGPAEPIERGYHAGDLEGAFAVVIASDDAAANDQAAAEAAERGVLTNRADEPDAGDFTIPAHRRHGPLTITASTDGISAAAARQIIEELDAALDKDWTMLLEVVRPYREMVQQRTADADERQRTLRRLTDGEAMAAYKSGGIEALTRHAKEITGLA